MLFHVKSCKWCEYYLWVRNSTVDTSNSNAHSDNHLNSNSFRLHLSLYTRISERISGASSDFFSLHYVHCVVVVVGCFFPFPLFSSLMCYFTRFVNTPDSPMYEFSFKFLYCDSICCCWCCCCCYCDWICCVFITMPSYSEYTQICVCWA